ncbi:MAG: hypothetical protein C0467_02810 [Planctomycetaceae bacterium]|nr:hypothetical protein [Planctomycetaceae bacterium]
MLSFALRRARFQSFVVAFATVLLTSPAARADQIDRVMVEDAGAIAKAVLGLKAKNIAVLKFQVKMGDAAPTFNCGTEGAEMIHRLENLLVLSLDPRNPDYTVLSKAGQAASALAKSIKTPVDWTSVDGRKKLFELKLPVSWNEKDIRNPDAYVTGTVIVSKNLQEVKIELAAFAKSDPATLKKLGTLAGSMANRGIWTDRSMLASLGQTYTTSRDLKATGKPRDFFAADESAISDAVSREATPVAPAKEPTSGVASLAGPISLKINLDGQSVPIQADEGRRADYKIAGKLPANGAAGQKVTFTLVNNHTEKLAVLLCLNGRNTIALDGESLDTLDKPRSKFRMYVLEPKVVYEIKGFLKDDKGTIGEIVVAPEDESATLYDQMNPETRGKIQMFVYGPAPVRTPDISGGPTETTPLGDDPETAFDNAFAASGLATADKTMGTLGSLEAAQKSLKDRTKLAVSDGKISPDSKLARGRSRGLFIESNQPTSTAGGQVQVVKFTYDEQPLDSVVINYYVK